jgi:hypothetical protein
MSDDNSLDEIISRVRRREEAQRQQAAVTRDRLGELGVTLVDITYDVYGDSGTIESVTAFTGDREPDDVHKAL